jgi:hypothetical protein
MVLVEQIGAAKASEKLIITLANCIFSFLLKCARASANPFS